MNSAKKPVKLNTTNVLIEITCNNSMIPFVTTKAPGSIFFSFSRPLIQEQEFLLVMIQIKISWAKTFFRIQLTVVPAIMVNVEQANIPKAVTMMILSLDLFPSSNFNSRI